VKPFPALAGLIAASCVIPARKIEGYTPPRPSATIEARDTTREPSPSPAPPPDAGATAPSPRPVVEVRHDEHYPPGGTVDVAKWLVDHGVTEKFGEKACWDARDRVGVPPSPGLVCERASARPSKVVSRIFRLEGTKLRMVWEGVVATWANWLELTAILAEDGSSVTVHERRSGSCEGAFEEYRQKEESGIRADFGPMLHEGCRGRGVHAWSGDRYP
jgi:hypothetical protein